MSVMTFNVHYCIETDVVHPVEAVKEILLANHWYTYIWNGPSGVRKRVLNRSSRSSGVDAP